MKRTLRRRRVVVFALGTLSPIVVGFDRLVKMAAIKMLLKTKQTLHASGNIAALNTLKIQ